MISMDNSLIMIDLQTKCDQSYAAMKCLQKQHVDRADGKMVEQDWKVSFMYTFKFKISVQKQIKRKIMMIIEWCGMVIDVSCHVDKKSVWAGSRVDKGAPERLNHGLAFGLSFQCMKIHAGDCQKACTRPQTLVC